MAFSGEESGFGKDAGKKNAGKKNAARRDTDEHSEKRHARRHQPKHSIILNNMLAMREFAFNFAYGRKIPERVIAVMDMLVHCENLFGRDPCAMELIERVAETIEKTIPPTRQAITDAVNMDMLSSEWRDGKKYFFVTPEQDRKLSVAMNYLAIIPAVVKLQIENPDDPSAGSDLLPPEVYYNVTCRYQGGLE